MDIENIADSEDSFWFIEHVSGDKEGERYFIYDEKKDTYAIPLFFSRKDAEIFFSQEYVNPEKWRVSQMRLSYIIAVLFLAQKQDWNLKLFYSYDSYNKGWGVKNITIGLLEDYYKA